MIPSVRRQKAECLQENKAHQIFWKTTISSPLIARASVRIRGAGKVLCFVKFGVFCFLITTVFRFILLPSYQIWSLGKCLFKISNWLISSPHKKGSFTLRISSVNVTKSSGNSLFDHIYRGNPWQKTSFFVQCNERVLLLQAVTAIDIIDRATTCLIFKYRHPWLEYI